MSFAFALLDYRSRNCVMDIFMPPHIHIHRILSSITIIIVTIVIVTIITVAVIVIINSNNNNI